VNLNSITDSSLASLNLTGIDSAKVNSSKWWLKMGAKGFAKGIGYDVGLFPAAWQ